MKSCALVLSVYCGLEAL